MTLAQPAPAPAVVHATPQRAAQAQQRALRWLDEGLPPGASAAAVDTLALAWALKGLCYEAWRSDPPRSLRAAACLADLAGQALAPEARAEVAAVAAWTDGIAALTAGRMDDAAQAFDRAERGLRACGRVDEAPQTQVPKIMALSLLGRHDEATACALQAQRELLALGNVAAAGRVSLNLGALHLRRDRFRETAQHYREASVLLARVGDHEHSITADIGHADALAAMSRFDDALHLYARAAMRAQRHGLPPSLALVDESVALVQLARGRLRQALMGLESACTRYQALGLPQYLAVAEKQRADVFLELNLLPEALAWFDRAQQRFRELQLPDELALALAQKGRTLALLQRPQAAESAFVEAEALFNAQGTHYGRGCVALARAALALAAADLDRSDSLAEGAAADFSAAGHAEGQARAELMQCQVQIARGQWAAAQQRLLQLLAFARGRGAMALQVRGLTALARLQRLCGAPFMQRRETLEAAIELLEDQRRALPGDDLRSAFFADALAPYEERLRLALDEGDAAEALAQQERFCARALGERLHSDALDLAASDPATERLRERVRWLSLRVQRELDEGHGAATSQAAQRDAEQALMQALRRSRLQADAPAGPAAAVAPAFSPQALQAALQPGDALVAYGVLDGELFAWVVLPTGITLVRALARWAEVLDALRALRFQIDAQRHGAAALEAHAAALQQRTQVRLVRLGQLVWAPLQKAMQPSLQEEMLHGPLRHSTHGPLHGVRRVLVVPHGPLAAVPFAALAAAFTTDAPELAIAPSAAVALRGLLQAPRPPRRVLALGVSQRLPHAAAEALAVAATFPGGQALVGECATLAALRSGAAQTDLLHLACHAQFRADNPRFSALHLHDQVLSADEAESLPLAGCTVVLSACDTAVADAAAGNEMAGLARAFLVAGAARVVATLWPVNDRMAADFMAEFYPRLRAGAGTAAAVRDAQAALRQQHAHPAHWAPFTVCGGW